MSSKNYELEQKISIMSDQELLEILNEKRNDYTTEAIDIANSEVEKRGGIGDVEKRLLDNSTGQKGDANIIHDLPLGEKKPREGSIHWFFRQLLWWKLDKNELKKEIEEYQKLNWSSARGISFLFLILSSFFTLITIVFFNSEKLNFIDVLISLFIGYFVNRGHRWAMLCAMIFWSFEEIYKIVDKLQSNNLQGGILFLGMLWWAVYMHYFFLAFKVEQLRRKKILSQTDACSNTGAKDIYKIIKGENTPHPPEWQVEGTPSTINQAPHGAPVAELKNAAQETPIMPFSKEAPRDYQEYGEKIAKITPSKEEKAKHAAGKEIGAGAGEKPPAPGTRTEDLPTNEPPQIAPIDGLKPATKAYVEDPPNSGGMGVEPMALQNHKLLLTWFSAFIMIINLLFVPYEYVCKAIHVRGVIKPAGYSLIFAPPETPNEIGGIDSVYWSVQIDGKRLFLQTICLLIIIGIVLYTFHRKPINQQKQPVQGTQEEKMSMIERFIKAFRQRHGLPEPEGTVAISGAKEIILWAVATVVTVPILIILANFLCNSCDLMQYNKRQPMTPPTTTEPPNPTDVKPF